MIRTTKLFLTLTGIIALTGCQTTPQAPPQTTSIFCKIPVIERMPETQEAQTKGGLEIAIVPAIYASARKNQRTVTKVQATIAEQIAIGVSTGAAGESLDGKVFVEDVTTPFLAPKPNRLEFTVRVNNKLDRVFRGQGTVVQFNLAGKLIPFGNTDYKEFVGGIVPPRNETEFKIYGPSLDMIPDKGTIGIFLYDVVTATDVAGNTTEKQNYEWYFTYSMKEAQDSGTVKKTRGLLGTADYERIQAQEQQ